MPPIQSKAFSLFKNFQPFHNMIHYYVDLSCFLVFRGPPKEWWALNRRKRVLNLHYLEVKYRSVEARDSFIGKGFAQSERTRKTVCVERYGFKDFFVPIVKDGEVLGHVQAGGFRDQEITLPLIENYWRQLTDLEPSAELPEFREFVRILLEIPVLDGPLFTAFQESLELFARLLADDPQAEEFGARWRQLYLEVFSKRLPHSYWMDWALGRPTSESIPPWSRRMETWPWTKDEIGLTRVPTTVLTVLPQRLAGTRFDWTQEMLRIYRLQRRSFLFAQTLPQTVGGKLDDYGAIFVTSADPKLGRLAQHQHIEGIAHKIRDFSMKELGGPVVIGVGETVAPGEPLADSYRQAVLALHLSRDGNKNIVFYSQREKEESASNDSQMRIVLDELNQAFSLASFAGLEALKDRLLKLVLSVSFQNPHEVRWHFRYALDQLTETVGNRLDLGKEEKLRIRENLTRALGEAVNVQEIVGAFQEGLSKLERQMTRPAALGRGLSMEQTRDFLDRHYKEPLRIAQLAQMAGASVSTFSREFKRLTGSGLEAYLQNLRVEEAKRLLKATNLPISAIVRDCGFKSDSYFTRLFRKKTNMVPQKYREKSRLI
ncbi:MAG TPA: helix-turn-helix domain-containing protein [bacterium]|nr:helix-turn-helix domain-containing protein [bacterium]